MSAVGEQPTERRAASGRPRIDAAAAAWLVAVPCAVVTALLVLVLGPVLGGLTSDLPERFWFSVTLTTDLLPEHTEHARYVVSLAGPVLLSLGIVLLARRPSRLSPAATRAAVVVAQVACAAALVACLVAQYQLDLAEVTAGAYVRLRYFTPATLLAAAAIAAAVVAIALLSRPRALAAGWLRESRAKRWIAATLAAGATAIWLLHAIDTDDSIANALWPVLYHVQFPLDETFAVVNGRTPLVDFTAQYSQLWPLLGALALLAFGKTLLVFSVTMAVITALGQLAIFDVLRRVTRSSLAALALYLPFMATSFFTMDGSSVIRYTPGTYFGLFPLRYAGPFLLAGLTAWYLERGWRIRWPLLLGAGIVAINNVEFGVPALVATVAALLWTSGRITLAVAGRIARDVAIGIAAAVVVVGALALALAGALPQPGRLLDYPRLFGLGGFGNVPMPGVLGLHLLIYLTYGGAIATATVRAVRGARDRVLTGMLAWSGIFGLGAGGYYIGHSLPDTLIATFAPWALSLALLTVVVVRSLGAEPRRWPDVMQVAVLLGIGVAACSLAQTPAPGPQLERIRGERSAASASPAATPWQPDPRSRAFFASVANGRTDFHLVPGAPIAILTTTGHRIADAFGVANVSRYTGMWSIPTEERLTTVVDDLRAAGGNTLLLPEIYPEANQLLGRLGFGVLTSRGVRPLDATGFLPEDAVRGRWFGQPVLKWVDLGNLRPAFLREDRGELVATYR